MLLLAGWLTVIGTGGIQQESSATKLHDMQEVGRDMSSRSVAPPSLLKRTACVDVSARCRERDHFMENNISSNVNGLIASLMSPKCGLSDTQSTTTAKNRRWDMILS